MQRSDVQLRLKVIKLPNGSTQANLVGYVNGHRAYVPNVIKKLPDETEEQTISNFFKDCNSGDRDVTGYTEGGAEVSWFNPRTNAQESFTSTGCCVWGLAVKVATEAQKLEMQAKLNKLVARKAEGTVATREDLVTNTVNAAKTRIELLRELAAKEALEKQTAEATIEPAMAHEG